MNPYHGRAAACPQAPVMPVVLSGGAWTARLMRNNCLRQHCHAAARAFRRKDLAQLKTLGTRLLTVLETRSQVLHHLHPKDIAVVAAVARLAAYEGRWLRQPEDWRPDLAQDAPAQWAHFLRHLLADYPVPQFLDAVWQVPGELEHFERDCWWALAQGRSLRDLPGFPATVSRRVLHHALTSGRGGSMAEALWLAQLHFLRAAPALQEAVMASSVPGDISRHGQWLRLVAKCVATAAKGTDQHAASFLLLVNALVAVEHHHGVAQVERLLRLPVPVLLQHAVRFVTAALQAHGHLLTEEQVRQAARKTQLARLAVSRWQPMLGGECFESQHGGVQGHAAWRMEELCSVEALKEEGRAMNHCVAGYVRRCRQGSSAIFSLRHPKRDAEGRLYFQSMATLEVHPATRKIVQIRARSNRLVNNSLMRIIREWAKACQLQESG